MWLVSFDEPTFRWHHIRIRRRCVFCLHLLCSSDSNPIQIPIHLTSIALIPLTMDSNLKVFCFSARAFLLVRSRPNSNCQFAPDSDFKHPFGLVAFLACFRFSFIVSAFGFVVCRFVRFLFFSLFLGVSSFLERECLMESKRLKDATERVAVSTPTCWTCRRRSTRGAPATAARPSASTASWPASATPRWAARPVRPPPPSRPIKSVRTCRCASSLSLCTHQEDGQ